MSKVSPGGATWTLCTALTSDLAVDSANGSYASGSFRGTSRKCGPSKPLRAVRESLPARCIVRRVVDAIPPSPRTSSAFLRRISLSEPYMRVLSVCGQCSPRDESRKNLRRIGKQGCDLLGSIFGRGWLCSTGIFYFRILYRLI